MFDLLRPYLLYLALYLGVALTGGSVVHLPMAPVRYAIIGLIGMAMFILASLADARRRHAAGLEGPGGGLGRYVGWSVLLSLGLGMLSGGIQHFVDSPHYAAALLPIGFVMSFVAYAAREHTLPTGAALLRQMGAVLAGAVVLYVGLDLLAGQVDHYSDGHTH